jgi:hypothetical protein
MLTKKRINAKSKNIAEDSVLNSPRKSKPFQELKGIKKIPIKTKNFII